MSAYARRVLAPGWTLIEASLVVVILGLVLALALPALGRVREAGRATVCASNLRSIMQATLMYSQERRAGTLPPGRFPMVRRRDMPESDYVPERLRVVPAALQEYAGTLPGPATPSQRSERSVWHCPSDRLGPERLGLSYIYNPSIHIGQRGGRSRAAAWRALAEAQARTHTLWLEQNVEGYGVVPIWSDLNSEAHPDSAADGGFREHHVRFDTTVYPTPVPAWSRRTFDFMLPFGSPWAE